MGGRTDCPVDRLAAQPAQWRRRGRCHAAGDWEPERL